MQQVFPGLLQQPVLLVVGLLVTIGIGVLVDGRINSLVAAFRRKPPTGIPADAWDELLNWPETYGGIVHWLGLAERIFFFLMMTALSWSFIPGWLLFKLGCYWGIWHNVARVRGSAPEMNTMDFMVAQNRRANVLTMTCLFSTLGNLLAAVVGLFMIMLLRGLFSPNR